MATPPKDGIGGLLPIDELAINFKLLLDEESERLAEITQAESFVELPDPEKFELMNEVQEIEKMRSLLDSRISKIKQ